MSIIYDRAINPSKGGTLPPKTPTPCQSWVRLFGQLDVTKRIQITGNAEYKFPNPGSTCTRAKKPHILDSTSMMNADEICHVQETLF